MLARRFQAKPGGCRQVFMSSDDDATAVAIHLAGRICTEAASRAQTDKKTGEGYPGKQVRLPAMDRLGNPSVRTQHKF